MADALAVALLHSDENAPDGADGWSSRDLVHEATGMVVAQLGLSSGDALALLRAHAFVLDADLDEVARAVVERQILFHEEL